MNAHAGRITSRIGRLLLKQVLIFSLTLLTVVSIVQLVVEYRQTMSGVEISLESISERYSKGLSTAMWDFDHEQLAAQLEGIRSVPYLKYVAVINKDNTIMEMGSWQSEGVITREIPLSFFYNDREELLGNLVVQASTRDVLREILARTLRVCLLYAAMISLVAMFIFQRFQRLVSRHLAVAASFFQTSDIENLGRPLRIDKARSGDEIDILVDSVNGMRANLKEAYQRLLAAQQETEVSEKRYRELVENAQSMILKIDRDGRILSFNECATEVFGYSAEEVLGKHVVGTIVPQADTKGVDLKGMVQEVMTRPEAFKGVESENMHKDGSRLWVAWSNKPFYDAAGEFQGVISAGVDITLRKQAEEALRENRRVLESILNTVPQSIFWKDIDSVYQGCNLAFAKAAGFSDPGQIVGKTDYELPWLTEESDGYRADDRRVMDTNIPKRHFIEQQLQSDGRRLWVETSKLPMVDEQRNVVGVIGIYEDITERKSAEEALRESEDRLESVLEGSQLGFWDWNLETNEVNRNVMWAKMLGYTLPEVAFTGMQWTDLIHPDDQKSAEQSLQNHLEGRTPMHRAEYRMRTKDGSYKWILDQAKVVKFDAQGRPLRMSGTHTDITEHRNMQEVMIQTEKMMSVGGLAAGMAHEINNPLSAILQSAQVVLTHLSPDMEANRAAAEECGCTVEAIRCYMEKRKVFRFLEGIREAGSRAARIVSNMLEFSRKSESQRSPANINATVDKSVELALSDYDLKKKYDFKQIHIERDYAPNLPEIPCTHTEIEQVILNLLKNAAQAMAGDTGRAAPPVITLRTILERDAIRIEVEDNGPGMPENVRKRVFEPFFTTKEVGEGTGLGLSVSYFIIVTNHRGRIDVQSEPGKGTRFTLALPLK